MFTYKTVTTNMSKKINEKLTKSFEKMSEALAHTADSMGDILDEAFNDINDMGESSSTEQNDGKTCITCNNGHVVIEGLVKSLKVNGVDLLFPKNPV